jgi:hypothetical protein
MPDTSEHTSAAASQAAPAPAAEPITLTYMPLAADIDTAVVDGVIFTAYEPLVLPAGKEWLVGKLAGNPWFTSGAIDTERQAEWQKVREARKTIEAAKAEADKIEVGAH